MTEQEMLQEEESLFDTLAKSSEEEDAELNPSESQPEKAEPEEAKVEEPVKEPEAKVEPEEEKPIPYHKDPRWKRMRQEAEEAKEEARLAREEAKAAREMAEGKSKPAEAVPDRFKGIFGEDVNAYKEWLTFQQEIARETIKAEMQNAEQAKQKEKDLEKQTVEAVEKEFEAMSEETGLDLTSKTSTERNQILDICVEYELFDSKGQPNIRKAAELRTKLYPSDNKAVEVKKDVVAKTTVNNNSAPKKDKFYTSSELRKMSINQYFT